MFRSARENPFAPEKFHQLKYQFTNFSQTEMIARFEAQHYRGAIVGPCGQGKSTLLVEIGQHYRDQRDLYHLELKAGQQFLPSESLEIIEQVNSTRGLLLFDGAEQLSWWRWRRFRQSIPSETALLITSHRSGLLPTLLRCQTTFQILVELVERLQGPTSGNQKEILQQLYLQKQGNIRECFLALYDAYATGQWTPSSSLV